MTPIDFKSWRNISNFEGKTNLIAWAELLKRYILYGLHKQFASTSKQFAFGLIPERNRHLIHRPLKDERQSQSCRNLNSERTKDEFALSILPSVYMILPAHRLSLRGIDISL